MCTSLCGTQPCWLLRPVWKNMNFYSLARKLDLHFFPDIARQQWNIEYIVKLNIRSIWCLYLCWGKSKSDDERWFPWKPTDQPTIYIIKIIWILRRSSGPFDSLNKIRCQQNPSNAMAATDREFPPRVVFAHGVPLHWCTLKEGYTWHLHNCRYNRKW